MSKLIKQEACQLFIEQEIEEAINSGDELNISAKSREIADWLGKLFEVEISPDTIRKRIHRAKLGHMSQLSVSDSNNTEIENNQVEPTHGGSRENAGRPIKFSEIMSDELIQAVAKEFQQEKKELNEQKKEVKKLEDAKLAAGYVPDNSIQVIHADFYEYCMNNIEPNSIDLVLTDPPYPEEYHHVWGQLGEVAARVLKPSGFLFAYSGHIRVNKVMYDLDKWLEFYWMCCLIHTGPTTKAMGRNMIAHWKPVLMYQKLPFKKIEIPRWDLFESDKREKDGHEWQQGLSAVSEIMEYFSRPNDLILEPFSGSGTTLVAAKKLSRRCIGIDNDIEAINTTKARLSNNE
jgi:site-specific DNA-methyltransferase (adenine-specific)